MEKLAVLCDEIEKETGSKSIVQIFLRQSEIGQVFQTSQDFNKALKMAIEVIKDTIEYYEGNDINEALVDPYIIVTSILMQVGQIQAAQ